jgi:hypothetical protein
LCDLSDFCWRESDKDDPEKSTYPLVTDFIYTRGLVKSHEDVSQKSEESNEVVVEIDSEKERDASIAGENEFVVEWEPQQKHRLGRQASVSMCPLPEGHLPVILSERGNHLFLSSPLSKVAVTQPLRKQSSYIFTSTENSQ